MKRHPPPWYFILLLVGFSVHCTRPATTPPIKHNDISEGEAPGTASTPPEVLRWDDVAEVHFSKWEALLSGDDANAQIEGASKLARLGTKPSALALAPYAEKEGPLQAIALAGIGWAGYRPLNDILLAGLRSQDPSARQAAAWMIGATGSHDFARPLTLAAAHTRTEVRAAAITAIGLLQITWMLPEVSRASHSDDPELRQAGLKALERLASDGALLLLAERMIDERDENVIKALQQAISPTPDVGVLPPWPTGETGMLREILHSKEEPLIRRALAAIVLGQAGAFDALDAYDVEGPRILRLAALAGRARGGQTVPSNTLDRVGDWLRAAGNSHPCLTHPGDKRLVE